MERTTYIGVEMATAGAGFKFQTEITPGTKEKVVSMAEISPIISEALSFMTKVIYFV